MVHDEFSKAFDDFLNQNFQTNDSKKENKKNKKQSRKPIHISTITDPHGRIHIFSVCSDGTIWKNNGDGKWFQVESIPEN